MQYDKTKAKMINPHKLIFTQKKKMNLSNYKLAKLAGVNRQIIDSYQNDAGYKITAEMLLKICNVLNIELSIKN